MAAIVNRVLKLIMFVVLAFVILPMCTDGQQQKTLNLLIVAALFWVLALTGGGDE